MKCEQATTEKSSAVGNAAKMREALVEARKVIKAMGGYWARETLPIIDAALTAPQRNCDVGSACEQYERFNSFCRSHHRCIGCPLNEWGTQFSMPMAKCTFSWAQLPYEEGGAK